MSTKFSKFLIMVFVTIVLAIGCEDKKAEDNKPESGRIMGTITFWVIGRQ